MVGSSVAELQMGVEVVLNFLKYVDRHDVCPEYAEDIKNAQKVCLRALEETPAIIQLIEMAPGHFNTALRMLHCTDDEGSSDYTFMETISDPKLAKISHAATISIVLGPNSIPPNTEWSVLNAEELTFEILAIALPTDAARAKYRSINEHLTEYPDIQPCGTITVRPIVLRDGWDNTATATVAPEADVESQFILEEDILRLMTVGMKLTVGVCTLSMGLQFIKYVKAIRPSYYVFLPQELMFNFKEPVPNERPARSVHDRDDGDDGGVGGSVGGGDD
ncbi:hypothetical protein NEMBOFW57_007036 [Staphylotrichum longicolle]|uniref:Uncharacterized protein n=1 Tax=Staphylotrichum longicolle TaxID=669026 RepID=A0AAD4HUX6_9PEZI|nr:hypothetical protein NEMBOFW57_007036 [Staphylotrichum longicolle]